VRQTFTGAARLTAAAAACRKAQVTASKRSFLFTLEDKAVDVDADQHGNETRFPHSAFTPVLKHRALQLHQCLSRRARQAELRVQNRHH